MAKPALSPGRAIAVAFAAVGLGVALIGCQPIAGPVEVKAIVWDEEALDIAYRQTTLETPTDLVHGDGDRILVRRDVAFDAFFGAFGADELDYEAYVDRNRRDLSARPLDLALHEENGVFVPDDFQSLVSLSMWSAAEKTILFLRAAGETGPAVEDDLVVGIHGRVTTLGAAPTGPDNAAYVSMVDLMLVGPPVLSGFTSTVNGTPDVGTSPGVIAHELGHRVFNFHVGAPTGFWRASTSIDSVSATLMAGMNEGVADLLALGVLGTGELTRAGFPEVRNLEGEFASTLTYEDLASGTPAGSCGNDEPGFTSKGFDHYCLATLLAAAVFEGTGRDIATYRSVVFPTLLRSLDDSAARISARTQETGEASFGVDDILDPFVRALPDAALRSSMCDAFAWRYKSLVDGGLVCAD